jgi:gliding motility-associated-like protein
MGRILYFPFLFYFCLIYYIYIITMQKKYSGAALSLGLILLFAVQQSHAQVKYTISTLAGTGSAGYSGDGSPASGSQLNSPSGVTVDGAGNIYIGDAGNNVIRVISGGIINTYAGKGTAGYAGDGGQATKAKLSNPVGVCTDHAGNIDIADEYNGRIRQVSTSSFINTIAGNGKASFSGDGGPATAAQLFVPIGVVKDASGNIYIADSWNHRIRMVNTSGVISTFAGNGVNGYGGDGGAATKASLSFPNGVAVDASGNVYIADAGNNRIRKVNTSGIISTVAGNGFGWYGGDGGQATATELNNPTGIFVDASGNMYIADKNNSRVRKVATSGIISTIAGNGTSGYAGDAGPATAAELNSPTSVTMATTGVLYIADNGNQRIRQISGGNITTYAGNGTAGNTGDGSGATAAEINNPFGVSIDGSGNVYIGDASNNKVRKVSTSGIITTYAGNGTSGYSGDGGPATLAKLNYSSGVFADPTGNVYIVDELNGRVRYVNTGGTINLVAGNGVFSFSGDGGPADSAQLFFPVGVATDYSGNTYIADCFNHRIRKVSPSGIITTFAGNGTGGFAGDGGPATNAEINFPTGVAADAAGNIYIADVSNNRIRKVNSSGTISTFAGNGTAGYLGDGGPATAAELNDPTGVMIDLAGNIVITDKSNSVIRSVAPSGIISTIAGTSVAGFGGDYGPATSAELNNPWATAEDNNGNIYITDYQNNRLRVLRPNCTDSLSVTFTPPTCAGGTDGTASVTASGGKAPYTYSWSPGGQTTSNITGLSAAQYTISVTDASGCNGNATVTMTPHPYKIGTIFNLKHDYTYTGAGVPALIATGYPEATVMDAKGNIYIADPPINLILIIKPNGILQVFAGNGTPGFSGDGGPSTAAQLNGPTGLAFDKSGNLYIADEKNFVVRMIDPSGKIHTVAGNNTYGYSGDGGPATAAEFTDVSQITCDPSGNVYICDYDNNLVRKLDLTGKVTTFAGDTAIHGCVYSGDGGPATKASLCGPQAVAMDSKGNLYITDYDNEAIRIVNPSGVINTFAGNGVAGFSGDGGLATAAKINGPIGIGVDGGDNVYFADVANARIRVIDRGGIIHTIAGNGTTGFSGDGGPAAAAEVNGFLTEGLTVDANYNIYLSEGTQGDIRELYACDCSLAGSPVVTQVACYGKSNGAATIAAASADPPFNYYWVNKSDTTTSITGLPPGIDTILVKDAENCWILDTVIIPQDPKIVATFSGPTSICSGATAAIGASISNPKSYAWNTGATTNSISVTPSATTTYSVTATDINGCFLDTETTVTVVPYHPTMSLSSDTVCPGSPVTFIANASGASYAWSNGATTQTIVVYPTSQQTYSVTVDSMTCKGTSSLTVDIYGSSPNITGPDSICPGDIVTLIASGGATYSWSNGATTASITISPTMDSNYYVIITTGTCSDTVKHPIIIGTTGTNCALHIYNGFTPNGDGHNDEWVIDHINLFPGNDVQIFNRWGSRVWIASNYDNVKVVWKGLDAQGQPLPDATYYYVIHVNSQTYKGWVQLTR